jgi:acyl transferase domain-containing protein
MTGVNGFLDLAKAGFLSHTGQCKPFDAAADGYCRSEGAGLVVLKKLDDAISQGDNILGVIAAIGSNQGGLSSSLTIPSASALESLYRTVIDQSGFQPSEISFVETHGTGTRQFTSNLGLHINNADNLQKQEIPLKSRAFNQC